MHEKLQKLVIGGLLHDIGKVLFRASDGRNHSISGYDFLKNEIHMEDQDILNQVRYHHSKLLRSASIADDDLAYITYMADNISAASDRRKKDDGSAGFEKMIPLSSIFNLLNRNHEEADYTPATLDSQFGINYPSYGSVEYTENFYQSVRDNLKEVLSHMEYSEEYLNSLLEVLEAMLSYVPSSTSKNELADISLFDHMKLTAAFGSCIYYYLCEKGEVDYKKALMTDERDFFEKKVFLLYSMDMSGIQSFIYGQYGNKNVLKNLRARSFYLEIMMENLIDNLLDTIGLSRANCIYSGGGHTYMLLPNTEKAKEAIKAYESKTNEWFLKQFKTDLYLACGYAECSANEISNKPEGAYAEIYRRVSTQLSEKKLHRYSAAQIMELNHSQPVSDERECRICHRSDRLINNDICPLCSGLIQLSDGLLKKDFFSILSNQEDSVMLMIGPEQGLSVNEEKEVLQHMKENSDYVRTYSKNGMYTGQSLATKLWVGDYSSANTLEQLVEKGTGIGRLGVLRADIDNLGQAFVSGFLPEHASFSRSATFSRKLSLFFKLYINDILEQGEYSLDGDRTQRSASIIYSGGDDVFIVGAWKDILEFAVDLYKDLKKFTQNTLTISAGFGLFPEKYPISYIAEETGDLEECSKALEGKNGITLFDQNNSYHWDVFIEKVLGEKFRVIYEFFSFSLDRGKSFLYNLLDLMRNREEKINLARFAYVLARMEPDKNADDMERDLYRKFSRSMYHWMLDEEDSRQAITAIYIYAYLIRSEEVE